VGRFFLHTRIEQRLLPSEDKTIKPTYIKICDLTLQFMLRIRLRFLKYSSVDDAFGEAITFRVSSSKIAERGRNNGDC